jgi:hypothetical protein
LVEPNDIYYRNYIQGDQEKIVELYNLVFNKNLSLSRWQWIYHQNPIDRRDIILGFSGKSMIAQSAGVPLVIKGNGFMLKASRIQDVMVHPEFRNRGIFLESLRRLTAYLYDREIDFVITFPNDNSLTSFISKLDYQFIEDIYTYSLPIKNIQVENLNNLTIIMPNVLDFFPEDVSFITNFLDSYNIYNPRSLDYLSWRFSNITEKKYHIMRVYDQDSLVGFAVFKLFPGNMSIDLLEFYCTSDTTILNTMLKNIAQFFQKQSISVSDINIWLRRDHWLYNPFIKIGVEKRDVKTHVVFKDFSTNCLSRLTETSFFLSMSDSDVY